MSGTKGMLHHEVKSVSHELEISPSKSQSCSTLESAHGNLAKGTHSAHGGHGKHGKHSKSKLGHAEKM